MKNPDPDAKENSFPRITAYSTWDTYAVAFFLGWACGSIFVLILA